MLRVVVLGAAAGGGVPQWNCGCPVCRASRSGQSDLQSTQASIAVSADGDHWYLVNGLARFASATDRDDAASSPGRQTSSQPDSRRDPDQRGDRCHRRLLSMREAGRSRSTAHPRC